MSRPLVLAVLLLVGPVLPQEMGQDGARDRPASSDARPGVLEGQAPPALPSSPGDDRGAAIAEAMRSRDWKRAETLLVAAVEARPDSPDLLRTLGGVFFMEDRPLNAAVAFKKAEALAPLDERSRFTLAMAYVALGRRDWALPELETLKKADPAGPLYPYWIARLDYDDGQYELAVESLRRAIELDPRFTKAHDNLGLCYEALGRFDDALRSYEEATRLNRETPPPSAWPPLNLGLLLVRLNRLDEAEARLRESAEADPRFAQARYHLGLVLEKQGHLPEAIAELEEAARLDPAYAEPHYALARVYRSTGEREKSARALARFREIRKQKDKAGTPP
jgi:tetratricopeptide (TPR) repeat protein